jgi:hypothetical protein
MRNILGISVKTKKWKHFSLVAIELHQSLLFPPRMGHTSTTVITYPMKQYPPLQEAVILLKGVYFVPNILGKYSGPILRG